MMAIIMTMRIIETGMMTTTPSTGKWNLGLMNSRTSPAECGLCRGSRQGSAGREPWPGIRSNCCLDGWDCQYCNWQTNIKLQRMDRTRSPLVQGQPLCYFQLWKNSYDTSLRNQEKAPCALHLDRHVGCLLLYDFFPFWKKRDLKRDHLSSHLENCFW